MGALVQALARRLLDAATPSPLSSLPEVDQTLSAIQGQAGQDSKAKPPPDADSENGFRALLLERVLRAERETDAAGSASARGLLPLYRLLADLETEIATGLQPTAGSLAACRWAAARTACALAARLMLPSASRPEDPLAALFVMQRGVRAAPQDHYLAMGPSSAHPLSYL